MKLLLLILSLFFVLNNTSAQETLPFYQIPATTDVYTAQSILGRMYNLINGPIADATWHTGQVASFRRSSGNPIHSKINQFSGTVSD
jgi:hypothetical protein